jgi:hypothetical protein
LLDDLVLMAAKLLVGFGRVVGPRLALIFGRRIVILEDDDIDIGFFHWLPNLNYLP